MLATFCLVVSFNAFHFFYLQICFFFIHSCVWAHRHNGRHCCCSFFPVPFILAHILVVLQPLVFVVNAVGFHRFFFSLLFLFPFVSSFLHRRTPKYYVNKSNWRRWKTKMKWRFWNCSILFVALFAVFCRLCWRVIYPVFNTSFSLFIRIIVIIFGTMFVVVCVRGSLWNYFGWPFHSCRCCIPFHSFRYYHLVFSLLLTTKHWMARHPTLICASIIFRFKKQTLTGK